MIISPDTAKILTLISYPVFATFISNSYYNSPNEIHVILYTKFNFVLTKLISVNKSGFL